MAKKSSFGGKRDLHVNVKTARGRRLSSTIWLQRQLNDPYVQMAKAEGYRSRAAYKLKEIDAKYHLIKPSSNIVDLGAAPGGWTQYAKEKAKNGKIIAIDISPMESIEGVIIFEQDFTEPEAETMLFEALNGEKVDVVLSDMAAPSCGHAQTDHIRIISLCEIAADFAKKSLRKGGSFVAKILQGGAQKEILDALNKNFKIVKHHKPPSSRKDSSEMYVIALDFRGNSEQH